MSDWDQQPPNEPETGDQNLIGRILSGYADRQNVPADDPEDGEYTGLWAGIQSRLEADQAACANKPAPEFDEGLLCAYADGEFSSDDPQVIELESWLHAAPEATRLITAFSAVSETVRGYSYRMEAACDIDVTETVMSRFRQEQDRKVVPLRKSWIAIPAVAAVLLLAVFAGNLNPSPNQELADGFSVPAANMAAADAVMPEQQETGPLLASAPAEAKALDPDDVSIMETGMEVSEADSALMEPMTMEGAELRQKEESEPVLSDSNLARATGFSGHRTVMTQDTPARDELKSRSGNETIAGFSPGSGSTTVYRPDTGMMRASADADPYAPRKRTSAAKPAPSAPAAEPEAERHLAYSGRSNIPSAEEYALNYCHDTLPSETDAFGFMYSCVEDVSR